MYRYGFPGRRWLPMLLIFFVLLAVFSGGFHRHGFFFKPLFCIFPFLFVAGMAALFMMRGKYGRHGWHGWHGWHGEYPGRQYGEWPPREKSKRQEDSDSDIFYV